MQPFKIGEGGKIIGILTQEQVDQLIKFGYIKKENIVWRKSGKKMESKEKK